MIATVHEYSTVDKSTWGYGSWTKEPDKMQGIDSATNYDTLIVRNNGGALCGYVGVPEGHPFFGVEYSSCPKLCDEEWCSHRPESILDVHGGVTFSDFCHDPTREAWEQWRQRTEARRDEAIQYPRGDMARLLEERGHLLNDYDAWHENQIARAICHRPVEDRPHRVWWIGFDCAHSGDLCPSYHNLPGGFSSGDESYKSRTYVESEIISLARQLKKIAANAH